MVLSFVLTGLVGPGANRGFILSKNYENIKQMIKMLFLLISLFSITGFAEPKVNQALAQVGTLIVSKRDVQILYAMTQIDLNKDNDDSKLKSKKPVKKINLYLPEAEMTEFLTQAVLDSMVAQESDSFLSKEVPLEEKVNAFAGHYQPLFVQDSQVGPLKVESKEIHDLVLRKLKAQSFLKFKTESLVVLVSDEEIRQYFQKNRVKFGSAPLEAVKENIRQYLVTQQIQDKLKEWFEILKRKYKVKYFSVSQDDEKKS